LEGGKEPVIIRPEEREKRGNDLRGGEGEGGSPFVFLVKRRGFFNISS